MKVLKKKSEWQLQEAKNSLSEVVNRALTEGAQTITRHGKPVVMVVSEEEFRKQAMPDGGRDRRTGADLLEVLQACPDGQLLGEMLDQHRDDFRGTIENIEL